MYNDKLHCGVLCDYDLSISRQRPRVPGTDRTGTIPFMAVELLTDKYWNGSLERLYRHELEAFIWILPFVFLRYQNGKSQQGTLVDRWMTSNYIACRNQKSGFQIVRDLSKKKRFCQSDFIDHWELVESLLSWNTKVDLAAFEQKKDLGVDSDDSVVSIWLLFVAQLRVITKRDPEHLSYVAKLVDDLGLENLLT